MATHSSVLAWRIPRMEEPGGLSSTGLQRVRHDLVTEQQRRTSPHVPMVHTPLSVSVWLFGGDVSVHRRMRWINAQDKDVF